MPATTSYSRGDVVLVPFPFTDFSGSKQRPALVVSPNSLNAIRPDVLLAAITSQIPVALETDEIPVPTADLVLGGLPKPSIVRTSKLVSIHQGLIRKRLGSVSQPTLQRVLTQIQSMFQA